MQSPDRRHHSHSGEDIGKAPVTERQGATGLHVLLPTQGQTPIDTSAHFLYTDDPHKVRSQAYLADLQSKLANPITILTPDEIRSIAQEADLRYELMRDGKVRITTHSGIHKIVYFPSGIPLAWQNTALNTQVGFTYVSDEEGGYRLLKLIQRRGPTGFKDTYRYAGTQLEAVHREFQAFTGLTATTTSTLDGILPVRRQPEEQFLRPFQTKKRDMQVRVDPHARPGPREDIRSN